MRPGQPGPLPPPRSRGVIALLEPNCTACLLCAKECPDQCIDIDSHAETVPPPPGSPGRDRQVNVLDRFAIDYSLCMYCGICVEVCPFDALFWAPSYDYPAPLRAGLHQERDRLADWLAAVPAPLEAAGNEPAAPAGDEPAMTPAMAGGNEPAAPSVDPHETASP